MKKWVGKFIGGAVGLAMGGPVGAVAGAALGHACDEGCVPGLRDYEPLLSRDNKTRFVFYTSTFSMLAKLVHIDGCVSQEEIDAIEDFMIQDLELNTESRNLAVKIYRSALQSEKSFQDFAVSYYRHQHARPQMLEFMIDVLMRIAVADGGLKECEEKLIRSAAAIFNVSDDAYRAIRAKHVSPLDQAYAVLESEPRDSSETIKQKYRRLAADYHPDKIASKELPEAFVQFAQDKFREIQSAYETIRHERGF
ncbi:MAG: TerB family tellurite resistance protein [Desulfobacterales bacterium]|jgi:DnaJ like chaperone protein|nr:TerB family tellurite resistance protein [Desulfobacterales bacterium]MDD3080623.1 TerB family tellurite resistance protein [Desulfobacterales bacterium]MDD3949630.1 TerB family tellurite resistance protein [Desulfobacterales bacterium]MDY0377077.1 TerB family tellurite resistance protein [Desulfobacterales bacterium]